MTTLYHVTDHYNANLYTTQLLKNSYHLQHKTTFKPTYYTFFTTLILFKSGNIKLNLGPIFKIPDTFQPLVHLYYKIYFTRKTISLKLEFKDLYNKFMFIIDSHHPNYPTYRESHQYNCHFVQQYSQYQLCHMLFALITILHLILDYCNDILLNPHSLLVRPLF